MFYTFTIHSMVNSSLGLYCSDVYHADSSASGSLGSPLSHLPTLLSIKLVFIVLYVCVCVAIELDERTVIVRPQWRTRHTTAVVCPRLGPQQSPPHSPTTATILVSFGGRSQYSRGCHSSRRQHPASAISGSSQQSAVTASTRTESVSVSRVCGCVSR